MKFTFSSTASILGLRLWPIETHFPACDYVRLKKHLDRDGPFLSDVEESVSSSIKSRIDAACIWCGKRTRLSWEYSEVKPAIGYRIWNSQLSWKHARIMRWLGQCGPKSPLMIGSLGISVLYLGLWMTLYWISFCLFVLCCHSDFRMLLIM